MCNNHFPKYSRVYFHACYAYKKIFKHFTSIEIYNVHFEEKICRYTNMRPARNYIESETFKTTFFAASLGLVLTCVGVFFFSWLITYAKTFFIKKNTKKKPFWKNRLQV